MYKNFQYSFVFVSDDGSIFLLLLSTKRKKIPFAIRNLKHSRSYYDVWLIGGGLQNGQRRGGGRKESIDENSLRLFALWRPYSSSTNQAKVHYHGYSELSTHTLDIDILLRGLKDWIELFMFFWNFWKNIFLHHTVTVNRCKISF